MIYVVTGFPRSGTSMAMQVLEAMGIPILQDGVRQPDKFNRQGYYEFTPVKRIQYDHSWLEDGKAVKIVAPLITSFPVDKFEHKIIYMLRDFIPMIESQNRMLDRPIIPIDKMEELYQHNWLLVANWLASSGAEHLIFQYESALSRPETFVSELANYLEIDVNLAEIAKVIKTGLK